jgi:hypothetical protein
MVPPELMCNRTMGISVAVGFAVNVGFYGVDADDPAVAVFGALVAGRAGFLHGLRVSLLMAAALLLTTALVSLLLRPTTRK